jgi:hypothetical protein
MQGVRGGGKSVSRNISISPTAFRPISALGRICFGRGKPFAKGIFSNPTSAWMMTAFS